MNKVFKVGLIGCGHIAETYFRAHKYFNNIKIIKCSDINLDTANQCAKTYNIEAVSVEEILKDKEIEIILNLTIPKAHYEIAKRSLEAGKHTYSEKPLAINFNEGKELLELSKQKKLYIGCAPDTFLGGGIQKTKELIDSDLIGKIKLGNAIFAFPGVQSYHPNPESWFDVKGGGPVIDMGPYYFTALVSILGPAKNVQGRSLKMFEEREIGIGPKKGNKFKVNCPTSYLATIEFENNSIIQLTLSFDVAAHQRNHIEVYGTKGSAIVPDPNMFGGSCHIFTSSSGKWNEYKTDEMYLGKINITSQSSRANESASNANYRGVGLSEMIHSIENQKPHRCSAELSFHVLDIIETTLKAATTNKECEIKSFCSQPAYFSDNDVKVLLK